MILSKRTLVAFGILAASVGLAAQAQADCDVPAALSACKMCHELRPGAPAKTTGPNISGVFGSKAMVSPEFAYSAAVKKAAEKGLVWTEENLSGYLADQHGFLTKFNGEELPNKMTLLTMKDEEKRKNAIAALKTLKECK